MNFFYDLNDEIGLIYDELSCKHSIHLSMTCKLLCIHFNKKLLRPPPKRKVHCLHNIIHKNFCVQQNMTEFEIIYKDMRYNEKFVFQLGSVDCSIKPVCIDFPEMIVKLKDKTIYDLQVFVESISKEIDIEILRPTNLYLTYNTTFWDSRTRQKIVDPSHKLWCDNIDDIVAIVFPVIRRKTVQLFAEQICFVNFT